MKDRKLLSICLLFLTVCFLAVHLGGSVFLKELQLSQAERYLAGGGRVQVAGQVYKREQTSDYQILYLKNNSIIQKDNLFKKSLKESRLIIYDKEQTPVKPGNTIEAEGKLSFFEQSRNPGNFDSRFYYRIQNIHAKLWSTKISVSGNAWKVRSCLWKLKERLKKVLTETAGEEEAGILGAMLLGERSGMDKEVKELYQKNGIAHVLAISGLHLSFIGAGVYRLLRRISGSFAIGGICGIFFLICYVLMAGLSVSAVRALTMFILRVGADMAGRNYDAPTALAFSAVTVVVWRPLSFYDGGFWLSFGAVLGVIAVLPMFKSLPLKGLWAGISINLIIFPILLFYFYEYPPYSFLLNLAVIPLMSILLFMGMAGCILSFLIWPAACILLKGCGVILELYEWLCRITLELPGSSIITGQPDMAGIIVYYAGIIAIFKNYKKVKSLKIKYIVSNIAVILIGIFVLITSGRAGNVLKITVLDVGQGDCIFIREPSGLTCLIDGGSSDVKNAGKYRIEPYLKFQGIQTLDYVFVSHGDSDHINGIQEIIARQKTGIRIKTLVLPVRSAWDESLSELAQIAGKEGIKVAVAASGQIVKSGRLTMECLQPGEDYNGEAGNSASMVLAVRYGNFDMLLTGDAEGEGEEMLTEHLEEKYAGYLWEVLKAAHHGSKNSTKEEFLEKINPTYTIISAGVNNRYGHPHDETLQRLKDAGSIIYSTQECGAISLEVKGSRLTIYSYLKKYGRGIS